MRNRWAGWIIALIIVAALGLTPQAARAQETDWRCVEINGTLALNIRSGPGIDYDLVTTRAAGDQLAADYAAVTGADGYNWLPVRPLDSTDDDTPTGWTITVRLSPCPATDSTPGSSVDNTTAATNGLAGVNQDGTLDRFEIDQVAHSVVLIANVSGSRIRATGTGTITTPDGLIVTNAHVVEDADRVAIGVLGDINDPPEYRYLGDVVRIDDDIDVALIAIRYDMDERPINAADLDLPYVPATLNPGDVFRGDSIYIFGYPGIGDDYLVVTTGSIVSVENGDLNGQRLPVWYRTDAEIAPGNSGGLAVNGNGEFVGIPTFVQTEDETGGRLAGIRPAEVALMAVMDEQYGALTLLDTTDTTETDPSSGVGTPSAAFIVQNVHLEHGTVQADQAGIAFRLAFTILDWQDRGASLSARVFHDDLAGKPVINRNAPADYRNSDGAVQVSVPLLPCCETTDYENLTLFLPYETLGFTAAGTYPLKIEIAIAADDGSWRRVLSWEFVTYMRE